jgi:hypothetical protein
MAHMHTFGQPVSNKVDHSGERVDLLELGDATQIALMVRDAPDIRPSDGNMNYGTRRTLVRLFRAKKVFGWCREILTKRCTR